MFAVDVERGRQAEREREKGAKNGKKNELSKRATFIRKLCDYHSKSSDDFEYQCVRSCLPLP